MRRTAAAAPPQPISDPELLAAIADLKAALAAQAAGNLAREARYEARMAELEAEIHMLSGASQGDAS